MRHFSHVMLSVLFCVGVAFGQLAQGPASGSVTGGVTVNTDNFEASDTPGGVGPVFRIAPNKVPVTPLPMPSNMPAPTGPEGSNFVRDGSVTSDEPTGPPPVTVATWQGIPQTNSIPPDPHVAVGPNHVLQVVNTSFRISDKNGTTLKTITADAWYTSAFGSDPGAFDPKVHYDHFANRWIMVWLHQNDAAQTGAFLVSVSDDSNPLGIWYNWSLPSNVYGSTSNAAWADYQGVGYDQQAFYFTNNQFGFNNSGYQGVRIRIMAKAQFYANTAGAISWTDFWGLRDNNGNDVFGTRPAVVYTSPNEYYLVGKPNFTGGTYFAVYRITNPLTSPTISCVHVPVTAWSNAPNVDQLGGASTPIDGGSSYIRNEPVYRDSALWIVHAVASGGTSAARYVRINTITNTAAEDVAYGATGYYYFYPALIADKDKNIGITFSRSANTEYAGAYFTWRLNTDAPGLRPSETMRPGAGNYVVTFGGTRNRWGDYMGAALDPADKNNVWFLTEYAAATNTWGVWVHGTRFVPYPGARIASSTISRDFGRVEATRSSDTLEVTLANIGASNLVISNITKSQSAYNLLNLPAFPRTLVTYDSVKFKVYFRPTAHGVVRDTIRILSNDGNTPTLNITHLGKGVVIGRATAGVLYAASGPPATSSLYTINTNTGAATVIGETGLGEIHGTTIHPTTREIYGVFTTGVSTSLYRLSAVGGDALPAKTLLVPNARAVTFANDGSLFAGTNNGRLYRVNITTGDTTYIGTSTGMIYSGLALNPITGKIWATVRPPLTGRDRVYTINPANGDTTYVGSSGGNNITAYIAFDARGKLYGLKGTSSQIDTLIVIDTTTAFGTRIGSMGFAGIQALAMRIDSMGTASVREIAAGVPEKFVLEQNYPNPFNPVTRIRFSIPLNHAALHVSLRVYDVVGREVAALVDESLESGTYEASFNATGLASGLYFYKLEAGSFVETKKMLLVR